MATDASFSISYATDRREGVWESAIILQLCAGLVCVFFVHGCVMLKTSRARFVPVGALAQLSLRAALDLLARACRKKVKTASAITTLPHGPNCYLGYPRVPTVAYPNTHQTHCTRRSTHIPRSPLVACYFGYFPHW